MSGWKLTYKADIFQQVLYSPKKYVKSIYNFIFKPKTQDCELQDWIEEINSFDNSSSDVKINIDRLMEEREFIIINRV